MRKPRQVLTVRLDALEITLVLLSMIFAIWLAWRLPDRAVNHDHQVQSARERDAFSQRYGPDHYSEREEEWMIRDYFQDQRGGVFVDVGANHYRDNSKTYYLESALGWSGLAIEPQREFAADYAKHRPKTKFIPLFVSDSSNDVARLYITKRSPMVASSNRDFVNQFGAVDDVRDVPTITLTDLLNAEQVSHVDLLSIDVELHEAEVLKGFDIQRFAPRLVCVEGLLPVRQQILNYFAQHGYVVVGKYMWVDLENLYFAPLQSTKPRPAP